MLDVFQFRGLILQRTPIAQLHLELNCDQYLQKEKCMLMQGVNGHRMHWAWNAIGLVIPHLEAARIVIGSQTHLHLSMYASWVDWIAFHWNPVVIWKIQHMMDNCTWVTINTVNSYNFYFKVKRPVNNMSWLPTNTQINFYLLTWRARLLEAWQDRLSYHMWSCENRRISWHR